MAWKRTAGEVVTKIRARVRTESTRNKSLTKGATHSIINHLVQDAAESLSKHGRASIVGLGRFQISKRTGEVNFYPYAKFLDQLDLRFEGYDSEYDSDFDSDDED